MLNKTDIWYVDRNRLPMWVVYDNPTDYPGQTVMRLWYSLPRPEPTMIAIVAPLDDLRAACGGHGYYNLGTTVGDDPCIVEVWV